jgi:cellulose biosynthesis protein BcsQ
MVVASVYNLKGGVGKTASCVNLAYIAAMEGYKTLLWDLDPQGAASFYFKAEPKPKANIKRLMGEDISLAKAIQATEYENLDIIPTDISAARLEHSMATTSSRKVLKKVLKSIEEDYDFVFLDCAPGVTPLAENVFYASDVVLMPIIPTTLSVRSYEIARDYFEHRLGDVDDKLLCFFSMADTRKGMHNEIMDELCMNPHFMEYYIPALSDIEKMGLHHSPIGAFAPTSYANTCYRALWREIKENVLA